MSGRTFRRTFTGGCLALATAFGGCAAFDNLDTGNFYVQPGKYQFLKCPDLAKRLLADSKREEEIVKLIERAGHDPVGEFIGTTTYGIDLKQVRADAQLLQQTMREKNCPSTAQTPG